MGIFDWKHWLVILIVVVLVFGTKRLTGGARDLGKAVDEFKKGMKGDDKPAERIGADKASSDAEQQRDRDDVAR